MSTALRALLVRLREENKINKLAGRNERIVRHRTARRCLETACSKLKFPAFTHRAMRHFFATCAIESAVDIPTVSRWLGHKDGGALAMRVYGHLRGAHSDAMIGQVSFGVSPAAPQSPVPAAAPAPSKQPEQKTGDRKIVPIAT